MRNRSGQNLIEFIIISALVVVGLIMSYAFLGDNIKEMFSKSSAKVEEFKPFGEGTATTPESYSLPSEPPVRYNPLSPPASTTTAKGVPITYDSSGAKFTVGTQEVTLSSKVLDDIGTVFQTAGSDGAEKYVVDAIASFMQKYAAEYPGQEIPLEILNGQSDRKVNYGISKDTGGLIVQNDSIKDDQLSSHKTSQYLGAAVINEITAKIGDHYLFLVNDQSLPTKDAINETNNEKGVYIIDGTAVFVKQEKDKNKYTFSGQVNSLDIASGQKALIDGYIIEGEFEEKTDNKKDFDDEFKLDILTSDGNKEKAGSWKVKI